MPSGTKTPHLLLNQWIGSDKPKRSDFVDDNLKIDTAVHNIQQAVQVHIVHMTQSEYDAAYAAETLDEDTFYVVTPDEE